MVHSYFKSMLPNTVGFDRMFSTLETVNDILTNDRATPSYPPYNIVKIDDSTYTLELAIAGFTMKDVDITLEDSVLLISGEKKDTHPETNYLHKGIALRNFIRKFTLADTVEVKSANIVDGLLIVSLVNIIPESKKPKKIPIGTKTLLQE